MKEQITIRPLKETEMDDLIQLCHAHAIFEGSEYNSEGKAKKLTAFIFEETPVLKCLVAELHGELLGYITFTKEFSTWSAEYFYHMDCLYLKEDIRKLGLGKKLMHAMVEDAKHNNINHIQWQTPESNQNAIDFYHRIGASSKPKQRFFLDL